MAKLTHRDYFSFRGAYAPPVVASRQGAWCSKITKTAGTPLVQSVSGGTMDLVLDATAEVQVATLYMGDILPYDIDTIVRVEILAKLSAAVAAAVNGFFGLAGAQNNTVGSITQRAGFKFTGNNNILLDAADGTNSNIDKATGQTLSTTLKRFAIDFSIGNYSQSGPTASKGGVADIRFYMGNANGYLGEVGRNVRFDMSAFGGNLQLLAQIGKSANAATGTLSIEDISIDYRRN
jgi:hypothetical protein